jgi:hypothetical protein
MSDITDPVIAAPTDPAAGVPAGPEAPAADGTDYSTHPVWSKAVEGIPEMLRGPLYETIRESERNAQAAIEKARGEGIGPEWRQLATEAAEMGVTVEELADAYLGQTQLSELLASDPDAFVASMEAQIDQLVASGQITRKAGAEAKKDAQQLAADEQTDALLSPAEKELKELRARLDERDQKDQQREAAEQQRREQEAFDAQLDQQAEAYFDVFDQEMVTAGLMRDNGAGVLVGTVPVETLRMIAETGGKLIDANPRLAPQQAVKQAFDTVKRTIEAAGGKLGPQAAAQVPVIGGSSARPSGQPAATGQPRTMEDREAAALAELERLRGES